MLRALFLSGRAHLEGTKAQEPENSERLGWVKMPGRPEGFEMGPKGRCIGWEDAEGDLLYLEPSACYAEAQALAGQEGEPLPVSKGTLWKRLRERGVLAVEEVGRSSKKTPGRGENHRSIALKAAALWAGAEPVVRRFTGEVA